MISSLWKKRKDKSIRFQLWRTLHWWESGWRASQLMKVSVCLCFPYTAVYWKWLLLQYANPILMWQDWVAFMSQPYWVEVKVEVGQKICYFEGWGQVQIILGSTHIVQQLLFSLFPSILMFDFDLILGLFFTFLDPNGIVLGSMWGSKTVLGSTHVVEQLSFSMIPWVVTFEFDLILGWFLSFWGPIGLVLWSD